MFVSTTHFFTLSFEEVVQDSIFFCLFLLSIIWKYRGGIKGVGVKTMALPHFPLFFYSKNITTTKSELKKDNKFKT